MFTAITYKNSITTLPGWVDNLHVSQQIGYAYLADEHYIHVYGSGDNLWILSTGLTATEKKIAEKTITDWTSERFGAQDIRAMKLSPGEVLCSVWRPGLYYSQEIYQALNTQEHEQRAAEQALRILIEKLDDLLLYIEPTVNGLNTYGHKTRELLILACTEVENYWLQYMRIAHATPAGRSFTTNDYVKLLAPLCLAEYKVSFKQSNSMPPSCPFENWSSANPTQSLGWYDSYNKTKHDRATHFAEATLKNCLDAISATITLFCVRYSPFPLVSGNGSAAALFNQHFSVQLHEPDPRTFYIPQIKLPPNIPTGCVRELGMHFKPLEGTSQNEPDQK
jgi:hypothetical protein